MKDKSRVHDLEYLESRLRNPMVSEDEKELARRGIEKIMRETQAIRSMRESLIRAVRRDDKEEIKDIHEYIRNKAKYHGI